MTKPGGRMMKPGGITRKIRKSMKKIRGSMRRSGKIPKGRSGRNGRCWKRENEQWIGKHGLRKPAGRRSLPSEPQPIGKCR